MTNGRVRWTDQAIDGLERRVDVHRSELDALHTMPQVVGELHGQVGALVDEERQLRSDIRDLTNRMNQRFDLVDSDHGSARWKLWLAVGGTIVIPTLSVIAAVLAVLAQ